MKHKENEKREVWYTTEEVLKYIHSVIEECALIVCPEPHIQEERECHEVAKEIRKLKSKWKDSEYVLRTTSDDNLYKRKIELLNKRSDADINKTNNWTKTDEKELDRISKQILNWRTARTPEEHENQEFLEKALRLLRKDMVKK